MKTYKRKLIGLNSEQRLLVDDDNRFYRIENISLGAHETYGCCPNEFKPEAAVPRGFYAKYGFKKYTPSAVEQEFQIYTKGNFTGRF